MAERESKHGIGKEVPLIRICPRCDTEMQESRCKLVCPKCGFS